MCTLRLRTILFLFLALSALPAFAQQTGSIQDKVTATGGDGTFQLPALPPGEYTLTFTLDGMQTVTRKAQVQLSETTSADAALGVKGVTESVTVTGDAALIDKTSAAITSGV